MTTDELLLAPKKPGIYYFRNKLNNKYYIGQAEDLRRRLRKHVSNFNLNKYDNPIYRAIRKYGWENFEWGLLEVYEEGYSEKVDKKLDEAEERYIKQYNSYGKTGYNQTLGGDGGIKGYKYTEEQRQRTSENSKVVSRDGRNKIYYFDVLTKKYGEDLTLKDFINKKNVTTRNLECLISNRYIVARSKEELENKIEKYYQKLQTHQNRLYNISHNNRNFVSNITDEMIEDIKNDMREKDFCIKYKVCRKTYNNYKHKIFDKLRRKYERVYQRKVSFEDYNEYRKTHSRKEAQEHFNISERLSYKYDKKITESE